MLRHEETDLDFQDDKIREETDFGVQRDRIRQKPKLVTDHHPTSSVGYDKGETDLGFQSD